jgi:hypothetical protein
MPQDKPCRVVLMSEPPWWVGSHCVTRTIVYTDLTAHCIQRRYIYKYRDRKRQSHPGYSSGFFVQGGPSSSDQSARGVVLLLYNRLPADRYLVKWQDKNKRSPGRITYNCSGGTRATQQQRDLCGSRPWCDIPPHYNRRPARVQKRNSTTTLASS